MARNTLSCLDNVHKKLWIEEHLEYHVIIFLAPLLFIHSSLSLSQKGMYLPDLPGNQDTQRLFFGQDRFHFVIGALKNNIVKLPRLIPEGPLQVKRKLRFFFDFSSPWTFIGYTQLARMKMELGPLFEIECVPILLGALFREIGTPNLPAAALTAQKREYATKDMNAWIIYWNSLPVTSNRKPVSFTFEFPSLFPIRTVLPLRVAIVNPATIDCIFRAAWSRDINIGDAAALKLVLNEAGFDGEDLLKKADGDSVKKQLRANNELAVHLGLCGAPTYEVSSLFSSV